MLHDLTIDWWGLLPVATVHREEFWPLLTSLGSKKNLSTGSDFVHARRQYIKLREDHVSADSVCQKANDLRSVPENLENQQIQSEKNIRRTNNKLQSSCPTCYVEIGTLGHLPTPGGPPPFVVESTAPCESHCFERDELVDLW
jgi:hypothetical protein